MKLKITCDTNCDLTNLFYQKDIEQAMEETGINVKGNGNQNKWIKYVIDHAFEYIVLPPGVYDAIVSGDVQSITFKTRDNDVVKVTLSR